MLRATYFPAKRTLFTLVLLIGGTGFLSGNLDAQRATANETAYVVTNSNDFGTVDLTTGAYTEIGEMYQLRGVLGGLGAVGGQLYGGEIRTGTLYQINPSNGNATAVGTGALSYFLTGSTTRGLYAVGQDLNLYSINPTNGAAMLIGPTGLSPAQAGGACLSSGSETLYLSAGSNYSATLYSLNTTTGAATVIGLIGSNTGAPPIVFENGTLYAALNFPSRGIYALNTSTGAPKFVANASGVPGYFYGLAPVQANGGGTAAKLSVAHAQAVGIRSVDFRNFSYPSDCSTKMDDAFDKIIHVSDGKWTKQTDQGTIGFNVAKMVYGDLKGDGAVEAVVATSCQAMANFDYEELFIVEMLDGSPKLLAKLSPPDWGAGEQDNGGDFQVKNIRVTGAQLLVSFYAGGFHAQPAWVDTAIFRWNGSRLVRVGLTRRPFTGR